MTNPTKDPVDSKATDQQHAIHDLFTTELTLTERQRLSRSRKIAFFTLAGMSVVAAFAACYFWFLWGLTAKSCIDTYILREKESALLSGEAETWQQKTIALDISSFSALILALLCTRLAFSGWKHTRGYYKRDGQDYFGRAYHSVLFTEGFETLCVRFGLLGTLLSFLLAAISQMSQLVDDNQSQPLEAVAAAEQTESGPASSAPQAEAIAALEDTTQETSDTSVAKSSRNNGKAAVTLADQSIQQTTVDSTLSPGLDEASTARTEKASHEIFLLLCASLVSTFVGTGVAYAVTPSLNWLNDRALGVHQVTDSGGEFVAEEFIRQVARTSQRLAEANNDLSTFEVCVGTTATQLPQLIAGLNRAIQTFDVSTQTGRQLAKKLEQVEAMSDRMGALLDRLPDRVNESMRSISMMAKEFRDAALTGETAFRELKEVAGAAREPLTETTHRTNTTWQMLREVHESLRELAKNEDKQTSEIARLGQAFDHIGDALTEVVRQLDAVGAYLRHRDGDFVEHRASGSAEHYFAQSDLNRPRRSPQEELVARGLGAVLQENRASLPWWRRIFG